MNTILRLMHSSLDIDKWILGPVWKGFGFEKTMVVAEERIHGWRTEQILGAFSDRVIRLRTRATERDHASLQLAVLQWPGDRILLLADDAVVAIAPDRAGADGLLEELRPRFWKRPLRRRSKPRFHVVVFQDDGVNFSSVAVKRPFLSSPEEFDLHYGSGFSDFNRHLLTRLRKNSSGVVLFRGPPGTGKTTYIRCLMWALRRTHLFHVLPVTEFEAMMSSRMTATWLIQKELAKTKRIVVVLEDAEELIQGDGGTRSRQMSTLLNLSDGLLGESLEFTLLATINCDLERIDPALRRRGRLLASREFGSLSHEDALTLAHAKGIELPEVRSDWTLAEIFQADEPDPFVWNGRAPVGFRVE